jgi:hypothetical protein
VWGATRRARPPAAHGIYRKSIAYDSHPEHPYLFCAKNVRFICPHATRQANRLHNAGKGAQIQKKKKRKKNKKKKKKHNNIRR